MYSDYYSPDANGHTKSEDPQPTYKLCCICDCEQEEMDMVSDYIQENDLCNRKECIKQSMEIDFEHLEGSELIKADEYYNNLLKEIE